MDIQNGDRKCTAVQMNFVARHGSRFPGATNMKQYTELHQKLVANMESDTYTFIRNWENPFREEDEWKLSDLGRDEMKYLGRNFATALFDLLKSNDTKVLCKVSNTSRAIESAEKFMKSVSSKVLNEGMSLELYVDERTVRPFNSCPKYTDEVRNNDSILNEMQTFEKGSEYRSILDAIGQRLDLGTKLTPG